MIGTIKAHPKIIFINSHPIQYFAPMYQFLTAKGINLEVWYCDDTSIRGGLDKQFGKAVAWDIPLLEGYSYKWFQNQSGKPSPGNGFFGIVNFNVLMAIWRNPKSIFIINGWQFFTYVAATILAFLRGHQVWMRCEMPFNQELRKTGFGNGLKRRFLQYFYFRMCSKFLYIGIQNKKFYEWMGIPEEKLIFTPYCVDNERFSNEFDSLISQKDTLRKELKVPLQASVLLYSGKFIDKKRPMDLLMAFRNCIVKDKFLIFLGEGELRHEMEAYIMENNLENVILTGFINQSEISKYYVIADVLVMCSGIGETWGLSINEAMNFNLPVLVSDEVGSAIDLIRQGENGYIYPVGNVAELTKCIDKIFETNEFPTLAGLKSKEIIDRYSFFEIYKGLQLASGTQG